MHGHGTFSPHRRRIRIQMESHIDSPNVPDGGRIYVSLGWHYHCCKHHRCTRSFNFTGLFATLKDFETQLSKAICSTHVLLGSETSEGGTTASIPAPLIVLIHGWLSALDRITPRRFLSSIYSHCYHDLRDALPLHQAQF